MFLTIANFVLLVLLPVAVYLLATKNLKNSDLLQDAKLRAAARLTRVEELQRELERCRRIMARDRSIFTRLNATLTAKKEASCRST